MRSSRTTINLSVRLEVPTAFLVFVVLRHAKDSSTDIVYSSHCPVLGYQAWPISCHTELKVAPTFSTQMHISWLLNGFVWVGIHGKNVLFQLSPSGGVYRAVIRKPGNNNSVQ